VGYLDLVERIKRELTMDELVPHHTGRKPIRCPLPGHEDANGSFMVYPETNSWWCPSHPTGRCGGSPLDYIMLEQGLDFKGAVRYAAASKGLDLAPPTEEERAAEETLHKREDTLGILARYASGLLLADNDVARGAREYLAGRGFDEDLLKDHRVGLLNLEKLYQVRAKHPLLADYNKADFEEAGLRTANGRLLFHDTRITFPLIRRQRVVGMTFRALPGAEGNRKFIHLAGQPAGLWNVDALFNPKRKAVLAEGIPDAMTLAAWKIPAAGNLGLEATLNAGEFAHLKEITLVWDNDPAGRARVLKSAQAIQAALRDGEVRILHMPGEKDINDWARSGGTPEEFQDLLQAAPDLLTYQIRLLPDVKAGERMSREAQAILHELLANVRALDVNLQDVYLKSIAERVDSRPTSLREMLRTVAKADPQGQAASKGSERAAQKGVGDAGVLLEDTPQFVAALDFCFDDETPTAHIGIWGADPESKGGVKCIVESSVTSQGIKASLVRYSTRAVNDPKLSRFPDPDFPRWTLADDVPYSVSRFLADPEANTPSTAEIFQELRDFLSEFIWYPAAGDFDVLALWIMLTYVYPIFGRLGYLHFNGGTGSGKSLSLDFVAALAFNSRKSSSVTESALFRTVHANRATMLLDEAEKLSHPKPGTPEATIRLMLNESYKRGASASRTNMDSGLVEIFETFGPKCFASINEIDHVFGNRCIQLRSLKKHKDVVIRDAAQCEQEIARRAMILRNKLHCWALTKFHIIHQIYSHEWVGAFPDLESREREIWLPIMVLAAQVDREATWDETCSLFDRIRQTQREKEAEREEKGRRENIDILILQTLHNLITGDNQQDFELAGTAWSYVTNKLADGIHTELQEDGAWPFEKKLTSNRLTNLLKSQHVIAETGISRATVGGKRVRVMKLKPDTLHQALQRLHGLDAEDAAAPTPAPTQSTAVPPRPPAIEEPEDLPF
jgi:DNA primase